MRNKARKLKRPDGVLMEEFVCYSEHYFNDGKLVGHNNQPEAGHYTGRFYFSFSDGSRSQWHTRKTAPKWMLAYLEEATSLEEFVKSFQ